MHVVVVVTPLLLLFKLNTIYLQSVFYARKRQPHLLYLNYLFALYIVIWFDLGFS